MEEDGIEGFIYNRGISLLGLLTAKKVSEVHRYHVLAPSALVAEYIILLFLHFKQNLKCRKSKIIYDSLFRQRSCIISSMEKVMTIGLGHSLVCCIA